MKSFQNQSLIVALFIDDEDEKLTVQLVIVFSENEVCWMITTREEDLVDLFTPPLFKKKSQNTQRNNKSREESRALPPVRVVRVKLLLLKMTLKKSSERRVLSRVWTRTS